MLNSLSFSPPSDRQAAGLDCSLVTPCFFQDPPIDAVGEGAAVEVLVEAVHLEDFAAGAVEEVDYKVGWVGVGLPCDLPGVVFVVAVGGEDFGNKYGVGVGREGDPQGVGETCAIGVFRVCLEE